MSDELCLVTVSNFYSLLITGFDVWDKKRQLVWLAGGLILGTWVSYSDSFDDDGTFVPRFFIFMESLVLLIMVVLFWIYSRKKG